MAIKGGVVSLSIAWHCNLDYDFMRYCLPAYNFRILDDFGWNFRHAEYHEEHRRTLFKMYGIKFIITIEGRGGKFNLKNTILNVGSGLALLGVTTVVCDFLLMYIKEKRMIKQKKYDYVESHITPKKTKESKKKKFKSPNTMGRDSSMQPMLPRDVSTISAFTSPVNGTQQQQQENIELH